MLQHGARNLAEAGLLASTRLVCGSGMAMPLADGAFDVVLCGLGTHHMQVPVLLGEIRRVLRPGGRLVVADAAAMAFWRSFVGTIMLRILFFFFVMSLRSARRAASRRRWTASTRPASGARSSPIRASSRSTSLKSARCGATSPAA